MAQPVWVTPAGDLGTIAENLFFQLSVVATDPDGGTPTYTLIAGRLPEGVQILSNGTVEGVPQAFLSVKGTPTEVSENVTSTFAIRATSPDGLTINDRTFSITVTGQDIPQFTTAAGSLGTFYDCDNVNITIGFTDSDTNDTVTITVDNGALPPGLTIDPTTGVISGHISAISDLPDDATSGYDASTFDLYPFDFSQRSINKNYEFTLKISDGKDQNLRTFTMFVVSRDSLTADTTDFTADSMVLTADLSPKRTPYITNYPPAQTNPTVAAGTIGTFRHDNFFAYQIQGFDCDGDPFEFEIALGDSADIPPGLTFDRTTGWLTGFFPDQGATETTYEFDITIYKKNDHVVVSDPYTYYITVIGNIENSVTWLTGTLIPDRPASDPIYSLGSLNNGDISTLAVEATNPSGRLLLFKLGASNLDNKLPQGLQLLESGNIAGRVSFNTFTFDSGTTTFDKDVSTRLNPDETTFDKAFDFTVVAYSADGLVSVSRRFRITINREYNSPYNGLYIKAMPDQQDRDFVNSLLQDTDLIDPARCYRIDDPYFGIANDVIYTHAFSLDTATLDEYLTALSKNHFRKKLILGEIKTAQALNEDGTVEYEVVYSDVIDTGVNKQGQSPPQKLTLPYPVQDSTPPEPDSVNHVGGDKPGYQGVPVGNSQGYYPYANFAATKLATDGDPSIADMDTHYIERAKIGNMLVNVASQMARDWMVACEPGNPNHPSNSPFIPIESGQNFEWVPKNLGPYDNQSLWNQFFTKVVDGVVVPKTYEDLPLIWSAFDTDESKPDAPANVEPFTFIIVDEDAGTAYIPFRGSQTPADFIVDAKIFKNNNPWGPGKTANGFQSVISGMGIGATINSNPYEPVDTKPGLTLFQAISNLPATITNLFVCGHSLGGPLATLCSTMAEAMTNPNGTKRFNLIETYVTASPMVFNNVARKWFNELPQPGADRTDKIYDQFFRLYNTEDVVPTLPGYASFFNPVGQGIQFTANYTKDGKTNGEACHSVACCYGYAIHHKDNVFNQSLQDGTCVFPVGKACRNNGYWIGENDSNIPSEVANLLQSRVTNNVTLGYITTVYPNSLINMRDQVVDVVGQTNTVLPLWMKSKQVDGRVLGFTKSWVIAYTKPGESDRISYNIRTRFGEILNRINWTSDRYILDNQLTANWVANADSTDGGSWSPSPAITTTFNNDQTTNPTSSGNPTIFDGGATQFAAPVDVYGKTDKFDKYLLYPGTTILDAGDNSTTITHVSGGPVTIDQSLRDYVGPYYVFGTSDSGFTDGKKGYYYPLYTVQSAADAADDGTGNLNLGNGKSHIHTFEEFPGINFYMPNNSTDHGVAIKPDLPEYVYTGDLGPMATVTEDTTPPAVTPSPSTPSTPSTPSYGGGTGGGGTIPGSGGGSSGGGSGGGGGGGYGSSSSSSSSSSYSY